MSHGQHRAPRRWARSDTPLTARPGEGRQDAETVGPAGEREERDGLSPAGPRHWNPAPEQVAEARELLAAFDRKYGYPLPTQESEDVTRRQAALGQLLNALYDAAATLDAALHIRELDELQEEEEFLSVPV